MKSETDIRASAMAATEKSRLVMRTALLSQGLLTSSASDMMVRCARAIVDFPGVHHGYAGRGPLEFDSFGLVRACAQAVFDAKASVRGDLADIDIPVTEPGATERMLDVIEAWGMRGIRPFDAEAGDVVIGRVGWPMAQVIIENHPMLAGIPCSFAHSAYVEPGRVPTIRHVGAMASTLFAAFTWRGTEFQPTAAPLGGDRPGDEHPPVLVAPPAEIEIGRRPGAFAQEIA